MKILRPFRGSTCLISPIPPVKTPRSLSPSYPKARPRATAGAPELVVLARAASEVSSHPLSGLLPTQVVSHSKAQSSPLDSSLKPEATAVAIVFPANGAVSAVPARTSFDSQCLALELYRSVYHVVRGEDIARRHQEAGADCAFFLKARSHWRDLCGKPFQLTDRRRLGFPHPINGKLGIVTEAVCSSLRSQQTEQYCACISETTRDHAWSSPGMLDSSPMVARDPALRYSFLMRARASMELASQRKELISDILRRNYGSLFPLQNA